MRILTLKLEQFRSYRDATLAWSPGDIELLIGPNGSGKTNILEAISILSQGKSCLGSEEWDLPSWGTEFYRLTAETQSDAMVREKIEVVSQVAPRRAKAAFVNDVRTPVPSIVGRLPTVIFLPQDLHLFGGPPSERRRFLDQILAQVSPDYAQALHDYLRVMKQRNTLLRRIADHESKPSELETWDREIAEKGSLLTIRRLELIETFGLTLRDEMAALGEDAKEVKFHYDRKGTQRDEQALAEELLGMLLHYRERDILLQSTTIGPHRDDWHLSVDGRSLMTFASRGQQRTAVLALLFLEVSYLELRRGEKPVILLDDVFSELDDHHQEGVLTSLGQHHILITSTHAPPALHGASLWEINRGQVTRGSGDPLLNKK